jgi:excisionase family DNA binding protein
MTDFNDPGQSYRRMSLDKSLQSPSASRPEPTPTYMRGRAHAALNGNSCEPTPAELIAHLVIALSRYHRQLRAEGGRVPAQIEDLVAFLADRLRAGQVVPMLGVASAPSAVPRRLLITKRDAAEQLGVSLRTIERLISAGRLPLVHVEGAARVRVGDLEAYVEGLEANGGLETDHQLRTVTTTHP